MADRSDSYLIVKRDLYYMPKACGYTGIRDHAGRYTLEEVAVHFPNLESENQDGMSFIHEDDAPEFTPACFHDLKAAHLQKQRDEARAELDGYRQWGKDVKRLTRQLDVEMHSEEAAAKQASLCDLIGDGKRLRDRAEQAEAEAARLRAKLADKNAALLAIAQGDDGMAGDIALAALDHEEAKAALAEFRAKVGKTLAQIAD